jgi:hypothetical protein
MRHILLVLPYLLHDLLRPEVDAYNAEQHFNEEPVVDPSSELVEVTVLLQTWYRGFRRCDPPKDEEDLKELDKDAHR